MSDNVQRIVDPARRAWPIFACGVLIGLATLVPCALQAWRDVRITWFYKQATCSIISSSTFTTSTTWGSRREQTRTSTHPQFTYQLQVGGRWYTATGFDNMKGRVAHPGAVDAFKPGQSYPCWYDPSNPEQAVLRRQVYKPFYLLLFVPAAFLLVSGSMLSRALRPVRPVELEGARAGQALAVRLSPELSGRQAVGCVSAAVAVTTAGVVAFFGYLIESHRLFDGSNLTTLAFVVLGIDAFLIYHLVRFIRTLRLPEPIVEIGREPLRPGDSVRLFVRQPGPARFDSFNVSVLCEEEGQKGTRQSHRRQLVSRKDVVLARTADLSETVTFEIPPDAQLSLRQLQTIVSWKIVVKRKTKAGDADREFVFRVVEKTGT